MPPVVVSINPTTVSFELGALVPMPTLATHNLLHDRDTKYCAAFLNVMQSSGIEPLALPSRSPNLNAFAERWVRSIRQECLSKFILFGEPHCDEQ